MASLTVRDVPQAIVERLKAAAQRHQRSMSEELRHLLQTTYADRPTLVAAVRASWDTQPSATTAEIRQWREEGRK